MWHDIREGKIGPVRLVRSTSRDPPGMTTKEYLILSGMITLGCRFVQVWILFLQHVKCETNIWFPIQSSFNLVFQVASLWIAPFMTLIW